MWLIVEEAVCRQCRNHTHDEIVDRPVPMTPSHRSLPISSQAFEHFVGITSEIVADRNHRRVHEADACTTRGQKRLFVYLLIKFFAKFIHGTENFCNFVVGNYEYILLFNFISDWDSDIKVQKISQITNFLTTFLSRTGIFLINLFVLQKKYIPLRMRREFLW